MSTRRPEGGMRPFRTRGRFPRRFIRGGHPMRSRGGYHKDFHKGDYHHKGEYYHRDHKYHHYDKYERHHYSHRRYSKSRSRSRSYSRSPGKYDKRKRYPRSYSRSRSRSYSRSYSRSRSRSRSKSRSRTRSSSRSRSHSKYRRSYTPDDKKGTSPLKEGTKKEDGASGIDTLSGKPEIAVGTFQPIGSLQAEVRSAKDMPLYSDEELEPFKKDKMKMNQSQNIHSALLERAMSEKQKLGLVNPGVSEKSSALKALQCYSPDAHPPSPFSDQSSNKLRTLERDIKPALKMKPIPEVPKPSDAEDSLLHISPVNSQPSHKTNPPEIMTNIPGLGFSSVDEEDEFLYGRGNDDKHGKSSSKSPLESSSKKLWLHSLKESSNNWSDEEDDFPKKAKDSLLNRISQSPSPTRKAPTRSKSKLFDLEELFSPSIKSDLTSDIGIKPKTLKDDEIPLMINQPSSEDKKTKAEIEKSFSIWESPERKPPAKPEKSSPVVKRILTDISLSPFRNRQGNRRPDSQTSSSEKNSVIGPALSDISIPLSLSIKRTIHVASPVSDRSKRSDSYHSLDPSADQRSKQPQAEPLKSQYKLTELCEGLKTKRDKTSLEKVREGAQIKRYDSWEESPHRKVSAEREKESYDKERHTRKGDRLYSLERSPGFDRKHRSPYHSPSYSPYGYSPRRHSPHRGSKYYSPGRGYERSPGRSYERSPGRSYERSPGRNYERSPGRSYERSPGRNYDRSPGRSYNRSPGRSYDRSPSPGYYSRHGRYRSPGRRSRSYSPPRSRGPYKRKYSRSPSPPRTDVPSVTPDIPLPSQPPPLPPPPPQQPHFQPPFYDPNTGPPQYPPPPLPGPYQARPVSYPLLQTPPGPPIGGPVPFPGQFPPYAPYPPLPVGAQMPYPLPPAAERTNLKVIPLQQAEPANVKDTSKPVPLALTEGEQKQLQKEKGEKLSQHQSLKAELEQLQKHQGEMMRKKQRQKDGHKDPLILENTKLQEEIKTQIAQIEESVKGMCSKLGETVPDFEAPKAENNSEKKEEKDVVQQNVENELGVQFQYFDPGNHWCKHCNVFFGNSAKFLIHLHTAEHLKKMDPNYRPWTTLIPKKAAPTAGKQVLTSLKGAHFLVPISGFYCSLCDLLIADATWAEEHLKMPEHNRNYTKQTLLNPSAERHWNKARNASMTEHNRREKLKLKAMEEARVQEATRKKKQEIEAERRNKELMRMEKDRASAQELDDFNPQQQPDKDGMKEKPNIKLVLLGEKEAKEKKKAPVVLIGKAPNFKMRDDNVKGAGISKLQGWKKATTKPDSNDFQLRKTQPQSNKNEYNMNSSSDISPNEIASAFADTIQEPDPSLIHGPHLPPDFLDSTSQPPKGIPDISWEEQNDLDMLGIDREDFVMIAAPRAPPVKTFTGRTKVVKRIVLKPKPPDVQNIPVPPEPSLSTNVVDMDIEEQSDSEDRGNAALNESGSILGTESLETQVDSEIVAEGEGTENVLSSEMYLENEEELNSSNVSQKKDEVGENDESSVDDMMLVLEDDEPDENGNVAQ